MHFRRQFLTTALCLAVSAMAHAQSPDTTEDRGTTWIIDSSRSDARFTITKLGFEDVTGVFRDSEGEIHYNPAAPEKSRVRWRVRVASVVTGATNRDKTLEESEYFDAGRHPYLEFVSESVHRLDDNRLEVAGKVTMRGVTQPLVTIVQVGGEPALPQFETSFEINRYDFGIVGGPILGRLIGRIARIHLLAVVHRREAHEFSLRIIGAPSTQDP